MKLRKQRRALPSHRVDRSEGSIELSEETDDRHALEFDEDGCRMVIGSKAWGLTGSESAQELLSEYLSLVYAIRGLPPGTPVHIDRSHLKVLETASGWTTDRIAAYLVDLMLDQGAGRTVRSTSRARERTRDTLEEIADWWTGVPGS